MLTNGNGALNFDHSSGVVLSFYIKRLHINSVLSIGETPHDGERISIFLEDFTPRSIRGTPQGRIGRSLGARVCEVCAEGSIACGGRTPGDIQPHLSV